MRDRWKRKKIYEITIKRRRFQRFLSIALFGG